MRLARQEEVKFPVDVAELLIVEPTVQHMFMRPQALYLALGLGSIWRLAWADSAKLRASVPLWDAYDHRPLSYEDCRRWYTLLEKTLITYDQYRGTIHTEGLEPMVAFFHEAREVFRRIKFRKTLRKWEHHLIARADYVLLSSGDSDPIHRALLRHKPNSSLLVND